MQDEIFRDESLEKLALMHRALADETRLRIVNLLLEKSCCVKELTLVMGVAQPRISQHLNTLRNAGMLVVKKEGTFRCYSLDTRNFPPELFSCVRDARSGSATLQEDLKRLLS